jgi:hypothetical protein
MQLNERFFFRLRKHGRITTRHRYAAKNVSLVHVIIENFDCVTSWGIPYHPPYKQFFLVALWIGWVLLLDRLIKLLKCTDLRVLICTLAFVSLSLLVVVGICGCTL